MLTADLVQEIIASQFPQYAHLSVRAVENQGHDHRSYRLGKDMLVRLPSAARYAAQIPKEQTILPKLATHISVPIPTLVASGVPSALYPYPFSVFKWINGTTAENAYLQEKDFESLAFQLATFLKELHSVESVSGPEPGQHNFWRGDHVRVYSEDMKQQIAQLAGLFDHKRAAHLWEQGCATSVQEKPVWVHGDFAASNILVRNKALAGVIDFGCAAVGDPACDLVIAWTFLADKARDVFIDAMCLDGDTWLRARAWALWKATYALAQSPRNKTHVARQQKIISRVLGE